MSFKRYRAPAIPILMVVLGLDPSSGHAETLDAAVTFVESVDHALPEREHGWRTHGRPPALPVETWVTDGSETSTLLLDSEVFAGLPDATAADAPPGAVTPNTTLAVSSAEPLSAELAHHSTEMGRVTIGSIEDLPRSEVVLLETTEGLVGFINRGDGTGVRLASRDGMLRSSDVKLEFAPEGEPIPIAADPATVATPLAPAADGARATLDVLVILDEEAVVYLGGSAVARDLVDLAAAKMQTANRQSGVLMDVRIVGVRELDYEFHSWKEGLSDLTRAKGVLAVVPAWKAETGADVVSMWVLDPLNKLCGLANLMETPSAAFADSAACLVDARCAIDNETFAHELGHVMGCEHDLAGATYKPHVAYAHGHVEPTQKAFRTIMATEKTGRSFRANVWSNSTRNYQSFISGDATSADEVRALNEVRFIVAGFGTPP